MEADIFPQLILAPHSGDPTILRPIMKKISTNNVTQLNDLINAIKRNKHIQIFGATQFG